MNKYLPFLILACLLCWPAGLSAKDSGPIAGPVLGSKSNGPALDKSAGSTLQEMITSVVPEFKEDEYSILIRCQASGCATPCSLQSR